MGRLKFFKELARDCHDEISDHVKEDNFFQLSNHQPFNEGLRIHPAVKMTMLLF
jgi:hypothetical protein